MVDTPPQKISWTREDVDRLFGDTLTDWQRAILITAGKPGNLVGPQTYLVARSSGKRAAHEHIKRIAIAMGYTVTEVPNGYTIDFPEGEHP